MKFTKEMKTVSRTWLCTLIHMSEVDADIPRSRMTTRWG